MIILDEHAFRFVEKQGFKRFMEVCCPMFKVPSRKTVREDCIKLFIQRKDSMKSFFQTKGIGSISITSDCWTSAKNMCFICVTAHFIGSNWKLQKKIISFAQIDSHKGEDIGDSIDKTLDEWVIRKVLCCTLDNASANDSAVRHRKDRLTVRGSNILNGKYLHMRCVAHIINLIVTDGLNEIGVSVRRVREAVKWVTSSPARETSFNVAVNAMGIVCKKKMKLDVPTRWNSTYLMLQSVIPYEKAIVLFKDLNKPYLDELNQKRHDGGMLGPPTLEDFEKVKMMVEYLHRFYLLTNLVSGTAYVTSHLFFKEMCDLLDTISGFEMNLEEDIRAMGARMKKKIGKYWSEECELNPRLNKILYIAAILDPRQKMKHIEKCLKKVYGVDRAMDLVKEVKDTLYEMFDAYKKMLTQTPTTTSNSTSRTNASDLNSYANDQLQSVVRGSCSTLLVDSVDEDEESETSDLDLYFAEKQFKEPNRKDNGNSVVDKFDILGWWSSHHGMRFPILSEMARDILTIPISTVASESAFSIGGCVLNDFRTSLSPQVVEAVICCEDWLRDSPVTPFITDEEDTPEEEQNEEYETSKIRLDFLFVSFTIE
ncbi:Putative AC transposase [Linum perenne]